jgi:hypothetical protein
MGAHPLVARIESKHAPSVGDSVRVQLRNTHRFGSDGKRL